MKIEIKVLLVSIFALTLAFCGCYYDNEEDLYINLGNGDTICDTNNVTYSETIAPIFAGNCNSCHSGNSPSGNIKTDNHASVKANMSRIHGAINHQTGFLQMPQSRGSLSTCELTKIDIWIRLGKLNN